MVKELQYSKTVLMISTEGKPSVCEIGKPKANDIINAQHSSVNWKYRLIEDIDHQRPKM
jgi:hypothetical protein